MHDWGDAKSQMTRVPRWYRQWIITLIVAALILAFAIGYVWGKRYGG